MLPFLKSNMVGFCFNDCTTHNVILCFKVTIQCYTEAKSCFNRQESCTFINSTIPLIENLANRKRTLFAKKCLCRETNDKFNKYFQVLKHKFGTRSNLKYIKLLQVKLQVSKQGFYFSGGVLYNSLPIAVKSVESYDRFKELVRARFS